MACTLICKTPLQNTFLRVCTLPYKTLLCWRVHLSAKHFSAGVYTSPQNRKEGVKGTRRLPGWHAQAGLDMATRGVCRLPPAEPEDGATEPNTHFLRPSVLRPVPPSLALFLLTRPDRLIGLAGPVPLVATGLTVTGEETR